MGTAAIDPHRQQRQHRLKLAILSSILTRPLGILIPFLCVPLFLKYLGPERYGLYESIAALAMWLALSNVGLGLGLYNRLIDCHVSGDRALAQRYVSTLSIAQFALALVGLAVLAIVTPLLNWGAIFPTSDPRAAAEIPLAVMLAGAITLATMMTSTPQTIYTAYQEQHRANAWDAAAKVATLLACFAVVRFPRLGISGVIVASIGVALLVRGVNCIAVATVEKPWLRPRFSLFSWSLVRGVFTDGVLLFLLQMAAVISFQTDRIVIATALSPQQVTPYAVLGRLFLLAYSVFMLILNPLWPAHGEAYRRGDAAWIKRAVKLSLLMGCGGMLLFGVILLLWGHWIIPLWTRDPSLQFPKQLIIAMTLGFVARAWVDSRSVVLNSANMLMPQVYFYGGQALLNLLLAILLAKPLGVVGVAWAMPIASVVTVAWGYPWMLRACLKRISPSPSGRGPG